MVSFFLANEFQSWETLSINSEDLLKRMPRPPAEELRVEIHTKLLS